MGSVELEVVEKRLGVVVDFGLVSFAYFSTFLEKIRD